MGKMDQKILCIPSNKLFAKCKWHGLKQDQLDYYYNLLLTESLFLVRGDLENDPTYKQIIPQVILKYKDTFFLHKQVSGSEIRLSSRCPLFLGGHVEEFDVNSSEKDLIRTAMLREVDEEAIVNANKIKEEFVGLIYIEDQNIVNHMHVGLVYIVELDGDDVEIRESELEKVGWVTLDYLQKSINSLTFWSQVVVKDYLK